MLALSFSLVILRDGNKEANDSLHGGSGEKETKPAFRGGMGDFRAHQALDRRK